MVCDVVGVTLPLMVGVPLDANLAIGRLPHDLDPEHAVGEFGMVVGEHEVRFHCFGGKTVLEGAATSLYKFI